MGAAGAEGCVGAAADAPIGVGVPGGSARQAVTKSFFFSLASFSAPLFALYSSLQAPAVLRPATFDERARTAGAATTRIATAVTADDGRGTDDHQHAVVMLPKEGQLHGIDTVDGAVHRDETRPDSSGIRKEFARHASRQRGFRMSDGSADWRPRPRPAPEREPCLDPN